MRALLVLSIGLSSTFGLESSQPTSNPDPGESTPTKPPAASTPASPTPDRMQRSVLCVVPRGEFKPESGSQLLAELNSRLPFTIAQQHFLTKRRSSRIVGWAIVQNDQEKDVMKRELKNASTLRLLQVEALTPEFEAVIRQDRLRQDLRSMIQLLERGAWNEMAERFVISSRVAESKEGLKNEMNRQITLAVLKELATKKAEFSRDGLRAVIQITGDDIPHEWRFENISGRWRLAGTL